ncbi:DNA-3-methyladenine glycosylase I [Bosea sp. PAMC 26642]|uniref:DNA-3-methyladenine glycosylase I n=1 Tax=Bosea sp. (strain PAMC 26642) TaxID=1792307 RepID=UPI000770588B|nr:DNA-3-methyladenine glycosylase I [Bosea sp. PAMC 26642]AMJ61202.1 DNA-3-methyladenine glycosylase [Bosea sp. PAMC 26642]
MTGRAAIEGPDGKFRCVWPGTDPLYLAYHDTEWGVPEYDSRALFEKLILDGFQAGLSWITILRKRDAFRAGFAQFEPEAIARFTEADVQRLLGDAGIIRHRGKIEGAIRSARAYLAISEREPFADFLWKHLDGRVMQNAFRTHEEVPTKTKISEAMGKELKAAGFTFCGPTIVYAFMEACGLVNDHLTGCFRWQECAQFARDTRPAA